MLVTSTIPPRGSRVIIYARFSSDQQNLLSADQQVARCLEEAERLGWVVVATYKDEAKTGRSVVKRAGYLQAMADAETLKGDIIMVVALDRLGRNARELHDARNRLSDVEACIYTLNRGIMSRVEFALFAEFAQMESERIAERTSNGQRAAAERGVILGDLAYGYTEEEGVEVLDPKTGRPVRQVVVDPKAAKVIVRVARDYDAGLSPDAIAAALTAEGVPTPEGGTVWHPNTIRGSKRSNSGLLRNPIYAGRLYWGKVKSWHDSKTGKNMREKKSEAEQVYNYVPWLRIVPEELFVANQARLNDRSWDMLHRARHPDYLLSGKMECAHCGGPYTMVAHRLGCAFHKVKACSNGRRVAREAVEEAVLEGLRERVAQEQILGLFLPEYLRELEVARQEAVDREAGAKARLAEVEREIQRLVAQVRSGAKGFAARILNEDLEALGRERERLQKDLATRPAPPSVSPSPAEVASQLRTLLDELRTALQGSERDAVRARDIVRSFVTRVVITPVDEPGSTNPRVGPMRITIEGPIGTLVDSALLDRKILHSRGAEAMQGPPSRSYRFYMDVLAAQLPAQAQIAADAAVIGRLLDDADAPVLRSAMRAAVDEAATSVGESPEDVDRRARSALASLRRSGWVRRIRLANLSGYVWSDRDLSDAEWQDRHRRREEYKEPISIIRMQAPQGYAVVIERTQWK